MFGSAAWSPTIEVFCYEYDSYCYVIDYSNFYKRVSVGPDRISKFTGPLITRSHNILEHVSVTYPVGQRENIYFIGLCDFFNVIL